jgi:hypothetical protein
MERGVNFGSPAAACASFESAGLFTWGGGAAVVGGTFTVMGCVVGAGTGVVFTGTTGAAVVAVVVTAGDTGRKQYLVCRAPEGVVSYPQGASRHWL